MPEAKPGVMHAALLADPFGDTVCGAIDGWRTQIASDITCPKCLDRMSKGEEDTHLALWAVEATVGDEEPA